MPIDSQTRLQSICDAREPEVERDVANVLSVSLEQSEAKMSPWFLL